MYLFKSSQFIAFCFISLSGMAQNNNTTKNFTSLTATKSNLVADAVGINTHLNYLGTVYDLHYNDIIKPRLRELGTKHIRDHLGNNKINERYVELAHQYGIKLLLINNDSGDHLESIRAEIIRLNQINPNQPVIDMIEPANETDISWNGDWQKLCGYLSNFKDIFRGNPQTKAIPLLGPSFANTRNSASNFAIVCKGASTFMDIGNLHAYSGLYPESLLAGGWGISLDQAISHYRKISENHPLIETESGYKMSEGVDGHPAVSERTAAKYAPRLVLSRLKAGLEKLYFYQLINNSEDFGLLNIDGSPRLQYTALKNFIHLMEDEGKDFNPQSLSYTLTGNLNDIHQQLFQKSNGKFLLVIWQGISGSEGGSKNNNYRDINVPERNIKLKLNRKAKDIRVFRPSFNNMPDGNGLNPLNSYKSTSSISLSIPDHIVCVEITK